MGVEPNIRRSAPAAGWIVGAANRGGLHCSRVAACRYAANGNLLSHRDYWDLATVLRQVGAP